MVFVIKKSSIFGWANAIWIGFALSWFCNISVLTNPKAFFTVFIPYSIINALALTFASEGD